MRAIWPGALLVVYLSATGVLLLAGSARARPGGIALHFGVLAAIAAATWLDSVPRWLRRWAPLLALLFLYSEMPMLISAAGHEEGSFFDAAVIRWEGGLFGSQPAREWAARWPSLVASELLHLAYVSYYPIIFSVPAALYFTGRLDDFGEAVLVLMLTYVTCFVCYVLFPVAGPRYLWLSPLDATGGTVRAATRWLLDARSSQGTAFPSSHVAVAVAQSILAVRYFRERGAVVGLLTMGLAIGAVYGGFHYAIDVIAGTLLGAATTLIGLQVAVWLHSTTDSQAKATAPT